MVKNVLVICSQKENYFQLLSGYTVDGEEIVVDQAPWVDVETVSYPGTEFNLYSLCSNSMWQIPC